MWLQEVNPPRRSGCPRPPPALWSWAALSLCLFLTTHRPVTHTQIWICSTNGCEKPRIEQSCVNSIRPCGYFSLFNVLLLCFRISWPKWCIQIISNSREIRSPPVSHNWQVKTWLRHLLAIKSQCKTTEKASAWVWLCVCVIDRK